MKAEPTDKQQPRLKDVAREAGVSPTTATMVFTGTGRISERTKRRVLKIAEGMRYEHPQRKKKTSESGIHVALLILIDKEWFLMKIIILNMQ